jgi:hypothetical protein
MNHPATQIEYEPQFIERSVAEQLALNRSAVAAAEDDHLARAVHPSRWERRGLFRRLRRRRFIHGVA